MRKIPTFALTVFALALASCAGPVYVRSWVYENTELKDSLVFSGDSFRLERASPDGTTVFSGSWAEKGGEWVFRIDSWKPYNGAERRFDPPLTYLYKGKKFGNGIAFYSYRLEGSSPLNIFIRAPSDFNLQE